ncbi:MAG: hypothetical protein GY856_16420 [bacterium]|nr:hypothetical protein [bacterium]
MRRTAAERRGPGDTTWVGRWGETTTGDVVLTVKDGVLSGLLFAPQAVYQIVPRAGGEHRLARIDQELFPPCSGGVAVPVRGPAAAKTAPVAGDSPDRIDMMVVYTPQARAGAGGTAAIEATIQSAIDVTNTAYANSQVTPRLRLVHTEELAYNDSNDLATDLPWVASDAGVAALRDTYNADAVSLMVESGGGSCGRGYVQTPPGPGFASFAFHVIARFCAVGNLSFAHELGHNQGCEHNPENSVRWPSGGSYPWSYGHWHNGTYRTVMSYSSPCAAGCSRQPYFSNSNVVFSGQPTGILDQRENYRTINSTATYVANFRQGGLFSSDFESGDCSDWSSVVGE